MGQWGLLKLFPESQKVNKEFYLSIVLHAAFEKAKWAKNTKFAKRKNFWNLYHDSATSYNSTNTFEQPMHLPDMTPVSTPVQFFLFLKLK